MKCYKTAIIFIISMSLCYGQERNLQEKMRLQDINFLIKDLYQQRSKILYYEAGSGYQQKKIDDQIYALEIERYKLTETLSWICAQRIVNTQQRKLLQQSSRLLEEKLFENQNALIFLHKNKDTFTPEQFKVNLRILRQKRQRIINSIIESYKEF